MSKRRNQLNSTIQRAVQQVIGKGLNDPRIRGLITVTSVELREDLRSARVNVSVLPEERESATIHGLKAGAKHIRREIGDQINMPKAPDLDFQLDRSLKVQAKVISTINKELEQIQPEDQPDDLANEPITESTTDTDPTPSEGSTA